LQQNPGYNHHPTAGDYHQAELRRAEFGKQIGESIPQTPVNHNVPVYMQFRRFISNHEATKLHSFLDIRAYDVEKYDNYPNIRPIKTYIDNADGLINIDVRLVLGFRLLLRYTSVSIYRKYVPYISIIWR
jgi:hypothetical protein